MNHFGSVFANSCLRVPVDPFSKMPKTAYERKSKITHEHSSIDSTSTGCSVTAADVDAEKLKQFYQSIPDYKDINHLPPDEFYSTLKSLRDKKNKMLGQVTYVDDDNCFDRQYRDDVHCGTKSNLSNMCKKTSKVNDKERTKYFINSSEHFKNESKENVNNLDTLLINKIEYENKKNTRKKHINDSQPKLDLFASGTNNHVNQEKTIEKNELKPKRNYSACSISWNDSCKVEKDEIDNKFDRFFDSKTYGTLPDRHFDKQSRSMPSSPIRGSRVLSPKLRRRKSITIPKPFKMTERDEDERIVSELRSIQKSFSEDMLHQKCERKPFRARPVPIESRIPLYDKILEDQAMRRAITKINSEAELLARMKPFSFTKREENCSQVAPCERAVHTAPKMKKKKRFRARPVPKNLFSNYVYDKMKEDDFFRTLNRRIRAEEMLQRSALPTSMAARESRLSTPAAHSDLPIDPSPIAPSGTPSDRPRTRSPIKDNKKRERKVSREDFITTSPQPFRFNTADRAVKKMMEATKKIYQCEPKSSTSGVDSGRCAKAFSALELRAHSAGRSNLAALLRVENVQRRIEMEATRRFTEQRRRAESRARDRMLRSKPAWHLVKNNHEEDIAMRLQTRRDEERMRREEFLHEMELMYGRVQQQPLLFERYYAPRSLSAPADSIQLSPRKSGKRRNSRKIIKNYQHFNTPNPSRKVSINDTPEAFNGVSDYVNKILEDDKLYSDSDIVTDSLV